jgi:hypothetical protein
MVADGDMGSVFSAFGGKEDGSGEVDEAKLCDVMRSFEITVCSANT